MTALAALLVATLALPPGEEKPESSGDRAKLQGTWTGKSGAESEEIQIEIVGDKATLTRISRSDPSEKYVIKGEYKIDETAKPKTWDFLNGKGSDDRALPDSKAIYELDGDTLKICTAPPGRDRPTGFNEEDPKMPQMIVVLTRVKPDASKIAK